MHVRRATVGVSRGRAVALLAALSLVVVPGVALASTTPSASAGLQLFASQVETYGATNLPNSFSGAVITPSGTVDIYSTNPNNPELVADVAAQNTANYPVQFLSTQRSLSELTDLAANIQSNSAELSANGVNVATSAPDPSSGTLDVTLYPPDITSLDKLAAATGVAPVPDDEPSPTQLANASAVLAATIGSGITLSSTYQGPIVSDGRNNDTAPFFDGDQITGGQYGGQCTGGFGIIGNGTSNTWMLTAGHCGTGTWRTQAQTMGSVQYVHFENGTDDDFEQIKTSISPSVWGNSGSFYPVTGWLIPANGASVTPDGSVSGFVPGQYVLYTFETVNNIYDDANNTYYNLYPAIAIQPTPLYGGPTICQPGDSGGPIVQRTNGLNVNGVAIIDAGNSSVCYGEQLNAILQNYNNSLQTQ